MSEDFLWINKSTKSTSLSSSSTAETRGIFQFVQQKRRAPQRAIKVAVSTRRRRGGSVRGQVALLPVFSRTDEVDQHGTSLASDQQRPEHPQKPCPAVTEKELSFKPLNLRSGACVDPFDSTVIPITKPMEAVFKYYWKMVICGGPNTKEEALPPHVRGIQANDAVRDQAMRDALSDKLALTGLLATMSARMVHMSKLALPGNTRPEHYIEAMIQTLRERLIDAQARGVRADPSIYFGIWRLAHAECILGNFNAARVHLQACKELLEHLSADNPMGRYVRVGVCTIDLFRAIETDSRDLVLPPLRERDSECENLTTVKEKVRLAAQSESSALASRREQPDPVTCMMPFDDILEDAHLTMDFALGDGLAEAQTAGVLDGTLDTIISDILDCLAVAKYVWRTPLATRDDARWMCATAKSILGRLCTLPTDQHTIQGKKTEALRLALIIMLSRAVTRYAFRSGIPNMQRLKVALRGVDVDWATTGSADDLLLRHAGRSDYDENNLLLWILMTGHHAAGGREEDEMWFRVRAAFVAQEKLGIRDYAGLHEHMRRYLYSRTKQKVSLETVALHL